MLRVQVICRVQLAVEDKDLCHSLWQDLTEEELLGSILTAHALAVEWRFSFDQVQPFIQVCSELLFQVTSQGHDVFTPPFTLYQAGFLGWLLKNCAGSFLQQYAAYSQQVVLECIASVHCLIEQGRDRLTLVKPLLQAWSEIISPVLDESHKYPATRGHTPPVCNQLKATPAVPLPMATSQASSCISDTLPSILPSTVTILPSAVQSGQHKATTCRTPI